jgi:histidinol dehydrogenase
MSAAISLRFQGAWSALGSRDRDALLRRSTPLGGAIASATAAIVADVRARGDVALRDLARRFDGVSLDALEVPRTAIRRALDAINPALRRAMERAARNIESVHRTFRPAVVCARPEPGIVIGHRPDPLERVGVYAPGGRASYPSSVLMAAVPARVAGVREVIVASPPSADGLPSALVLAAAALGDVDRVFAIGGAGAIAAMAFGTASVPRVDRIVGPGNAYVAAAKLLVVGDVAIDAPAGPSELLVIADASSDPELVAAEMIAQAEHDPLACVVALVTGDAAAEAIAGALARQAADAARGDIVRSALENQGGILTASGREEVVQIACLYAPEHLLLATADATALLPEIRNAGCIFVGSSSSVTFGDYLTGANHVLPTGGAARSYSGLSTLDFVRWTSWQLVEPDAARSLASDVDVFANAESLPGHASAARLRSDDR